MLTYNINWRKFKRGYSFFIPCINSSAAKRDILAVVKKQKFDVVMKVVIEENIEVEISLSGTVTRIEL
jgi:hypothetical protein